MSFGLMLALQVEEDLRPAVCSSVYVTFEHQVWPRVCATIVKT